MSSGQRSSRSASRERRNDFKPPSAVPPPMSRTGSSNSITNSRPLSKGIQYTNTEKPINESEIKMYRAMEDILPSFEMHNYMLNRTIHTEVDSVKKGKVNSLPTYDQVSTGQNNTQSIEDPTANPEKLVLNNLDNIAKLEVPLKVSIVITKTYPSMGVPLVRENALREFYPGDIVTGVVYIENTGPLPIPFEMLLVSLEGVCTVPHPTFKDQLVRKTFLKMFDFGACFHFGYIPTTNLNTPEDIILDEMDNAYYGMSDTRELPPYTKFKKFFLFKIPSSLLDIACDHSLSEHTDELPPTFGVDIQSFDGMASQIELNDILGYGRLANVGTPVKTNDQSEYGQSISYSVNVRLLVTKDRIDMKSYYAPQANFDSDFFMLSECQHFFRFTSVDKDALTRVLYSNEQNTDSGFASKLQFKQPKTSVQIENLFKIAHQKVVELEEREKLMKIGVTDNNQLQQLTYDIPDNQTFTINTANEKKVTQLKLKTTVDPILKVSTNDPQSNIETSQIEVQLTKKKQSFSFSTKKPEAISSLTITLSVNKADCLSPVTPRTLTKLAETIPKASDNGLTTMPPMSPAESPQMSPILSPVASASALNLSSDKLYTVSSIASNISSASSLNEVPYMGSLNNITNTLTPYLKTVVVELQYKPPDSANGIDANLPEISSIKPALKSVVISTPNPNPIVFEEFLFTEIAMKASNNAFNEVREQASLYISQIKELSKRTSKGVPKQLFYDLVALAYMKINESRTSLFKTAHESRKEIEHITNWERQNDGSYIKKIRVPLNEEEEVYKKSCVIPGFLNCFFSKYYYLNFTFSFKKHQTNDGRSITLDVPVRVAKIV